MKKSNFFFTALLAIAVTSVCRAGLDDVTITATASGISTNAGTSSFVVRGTVEGIVVKVTGGGTPDNNISLTSDDGQTIFAKASNTRGTNTYAIVTPVFVASTGAALTDTHYYSTNAANSTSYTVAKYGGMPVASKITLSVINLTATTTNTTSVKVMYRN